MGLLQPCELAAAVVMISACGRAPEAAAPLDAAAPRLEHVIDIGCAECDGVEQLTPLNIGVHGDGSTLVVDEHEPFVRVFRADATLEFAVGRRGQGPGEFVYPVAASRASDGTIWVFDGLGKMVHLDVGGDLLNVERLPQRLPTTFDFNVPRGGLYALSRPMPGGGAPRVAGTRTVEHWEPGLEETRTLVANSDLPRSAEDPTSTMRGLAVAVAADRRLVLADWVGYRIQLYDSGGTPSGATLQHAVPRPMKSAERLERERDQARQMGNDPAEVDPTDNHFASLRFDAAGRLWVLTRRGGEGATIFDVFDADLDIPPAEVSLDRRVPRGYELFAIAGEYLATIVEDDKGTRRASLWRIVESSQPATIVDG